LARRAVGGACGRRAPAGGSPAAEPDSAGRFPVGGADEGLGGGGQELLVLEGHRDDAEVDLAAVLLAGERDRREQATERLVVERVHRFGDLGGGRVVVEQR